MFTLLRIKAPATLLLAIAAVTAIRARAEPLLPGASDADALEQITVTAEKISEVLDKTPLSIAVVNGAAAAQHGQFQLDEVMAEVGGVKVLEAENGPTFYIRGIGTGVPPSVGDPEINLNVDGVYQSQAEFARAGLYDVDRIEVLRGPQGTLYGRNALAGVVNIVTKDPSFIFEASGSLGFGDYDLIQTQAMVNLPLNERIAIRFALETAHHDGYLTNGADDLDVQSERVKILFKPTDSVALLVAIDNTHEGGEGEGEIQVVPPPKGVATGGAGLGDAILSSNPWASPDPGDAARDTNFWSARGQLEWDLGALSLTAIAAHRQESYSCVNCWRSETDQNNYADERQDTAELRLASPAGSAASWLAGFYYLRSSNPTESQQLGPGADSFSDSSGNQVNQQGQVAFGATSFAIFAESAYPILDRLRVTAGLRYTVDGKSETAYVSSETGGVVGVSTGLFSTDHQWRSLTYAVGPDYEFSDNSMAYAKLSTGYKAGGFYEGAAPDSYGPEHLTSYEVGDKSRFDDGRIEVDADAFFYDYHDYQVNYLGFINPTNAGIFGILTANASGARIYGAEVEALCQLTTNDKFDAAVYPLMSKFKTLVIGGPFGGNFSGFALPFAPRFSASLGYQHRFDLADQQSLTARIESRYESSSWVTFSEARGTRQPKHTVSTAYLTYGPRDGNWSVSGYVKNIENTPVLVNAQGGPAGLETADIAPPRTIGVQISKKFAR